MHELLLQIAAIIITNRCGICIQTRKGQVATHCNKHRMLRVSMEYLGKAGCPLTGTASR